MADEDPLDTRPIVHLLTQILEQLQELNQAVRELPIAIGTEVSARL